MSGCKTISIQARLRDIILPICTPRVIKTVVCNALWDVFVALETIKLDIFSKSYSIQLIPNFWAVAVGTV